MHLCRISKGPGKSSSYQIINLHKGVLNPLTTKFSQKQISTKFPNFILWNFEKQIAPCVSTGRELSFEWSHHRISSTDSKVRVTLQNSIKHSGSERVKGISSLFVFLWGMQAYIIWITRKQFSSEGEIT